MIKELGKTALVAAIVLSFVAAPFAGALCTMSCADGGTACCCTSAVPGEVSLEKPSCCEGEIAGSSRAEFGEIMAADSGRTVLPAVDLPRGEEVAFLETLPAGPALLHEESRSARSSPIFLLTASLLI